jgi:hypothetical protein
MLAIVCLEACLGLKTEQFPYYQQPYPFYGYYATPQMAPQLPIFYQQTQPPATYMAQQSFMPSTNTYPPPQDNDAYARFDSKKMQSPVALLAVTPPMVIPDPEAEAQRLLEGSRDPSSLTWTKQKDSAPKNQQLRAKSRKDDTELKESFEKVTTIPSWGDSTTRTQTKVPVKRVLSWDSLLGR